MVCFAENSFCKSPRQMKARFWGTPYPVSPKKKKKLGKHTPWSQGVVWQKEISWRTSYVAVGGNRCNNPYEITKLHSQSLKLLKFKIRPGKIGRLHYFSIWLTEKQSASFDMNTTHPQKLIIGTFKHAILLPKASHLPTVTTWVLPWFSPAQPCFPYLQRPPNQPPSTPPAAPSLRISCIGVVVFSLSLRLALGKGANYHKAFLRDDHEPPWFSMEKLGLKKNSPQNVENSWKCWWEILLRWLIPIDCQKMGLQQKKCASKNVTSSTYRKGGLACIIHPQLSCHLLVL